MRESRVTKARSVRAELLLALLLIAGGFALYLARGDLWASLKIDLNITLGLAVSFAALGSVRLALLYLQGSIRLPLLESLERHESLHAETIDSEDYQYLRSVLDAATDRIDQIEELLSNPKDSASLTSEERAEIVDSVKGSLPAELAANLRTQFEQETSSAVFRQKIQQIFEYSVERRLLAEISALTRRGNLNLIIGVLTTIAAVTLLAYMVLGIPSGGKTSVELVEYYLPRLATAVFIEVFSFFFLRLYRSSLAEIRYYQDELTRISERRVLLLEAEATGQPEIIAKALEGIKPSAPQEQSAVNDRKVAGSLEVKSQDLAKFVDSATKLLAGASPK